jgi:4-diphosphocytidyl-2-C-methyl-D-erythritol kinase
LIARPATIREHAPAKVNLALHVTGRRADGYHLIESLCVFCAFGDTITVSPADADEFNLTGRFAGSVPAGPDNLVLRARETFRAQLGAGSNQPVSILLAKAIPVTSGVGGGSSDAAATLRAMARFFGQEPEDAELRQFGIRLGADVPMCLAARPLIARGIGEEIEPIASFPALHLVLVNPGVAVETPRVFAALARKDNPALPPLPDDLDTNSLLYWLQTTRNDLAAPALALAPDIGEAIAALGAEGALLARMSGSGATCFGIFADAEAADRAASSILARRPGFFVTATSTTAGGSP